MVLIPYFGASGAAISSVFAEILILCVMLVFIYKKTPIRFCNFKDTSINLTLSLFFIFIAYMIGAYSSGWSFVFITIVGSTLFYLCGQYLAKTSSSMMLAEMVKSKFKLNNERLS